MKRAYRRVVLVFEAADDDRRVVAAEPERVRDADPHVGLAGLVRDVVEIALWVRILVVDGRRQATAIDRERREDRLDRAGRAEAVAGRALGRRDRRVARILLAERELQHARLRRIAERRRRA